MMHDMMNMTGGMGWMMGLVWLLLVLLLVLGGRSPREARIFQMTSLTQPGG